MGQEGAKDFGKLLAKNFWRMSEHVAGVALTDINCSSLHSFAGLFYYLSYDLFHSYSDLTSTFESIRIVRASSWSSVPAELNKAESKLRNFSRISVCPT